MKHPLQLLWIPFMAMVPLSGSAAGIDVNFDAGDELTNLFSINSVYPDGNRLIQVSSGGVLDSGAVDVSTLGGHATAIYDVASFNFALPASTLTASAFFRFQGTDLPQFNSRNILTLGFVDGADQHFLAYANQMSVNVNADHTGITRLSIGYGGRGTGLALDLGLIPGHWYRLSGTFVNATTGVDAVASIDDYGTTGATLLAPVSTFSYQVGPVGNLLRDSTVWLGFETSSEGGADMIDNLVAVPEPGPLVLLALGSALFVWRRKVVRLWAGHAF